MKKLLSVFVTALLVVGLLAGCAKSDKVTIAVPNDTTNEARALLLLENLGIIKLKDGVGITATKMTLLKIHTILKFKK